MSNLALLAIGMALGFALGGTNLYLAHRRRQAFAKVQGLYLETVEPLDYGTAMAAALGASVGPDQHVCTFKPCPHLEREAERQATADRLKGGGR